MYVLYILQVIFQQRKESITVLIVVRLCAARMPFYLVLVKEPSRDNLKMCKSCLGIKNSNFCKEIVCEYWNRRVGEN